MTFPTYPKIQTLLERDPETFTVTDCSPYRCPEFAVIDRWEVTEKIDGTNVRVHLPPADDPGSPIEFGETPDLLPPVKFGGRTDRAQLYAPLLDYLMRTFTTEKMREVFPDGGTLFGEGYGARIQKGGGDYRPDPAFRLFDAKVGHIWLRRDSIEDIAAGLGIKPAPLLGCEESTADVIDFVKNGFASEVAREEGPDSKQGMARLAEGIVARSNPLLLDRMGRRVMWKLKTRDFAGGR